MLNSVKSQPESNECQSLLFFCICTAILYSSSEWFISDVCHSCFVLSTLEEMNIYFSFVILVRSLTQSLHIPLSNSSNPPGGHALILGTDLVLNVLTGNGE